MRPWIVLALVGEGMCTARIGLRFEVAALFEEVRDEARKLASFDIGVGRFPKEDRAGKLGVSL